MGDTYAYVTFDIHVFGFYPESNYSEDYGKMLLNDDSQAALNALRGSVYWFYDMFFISREYTNMELDGLCPSIKKAINDNENVRVNEHILWSVKDPTWNLSSSTIVTTEEGDVGYELKGSATCMVGVPQGVDVATFRREFHFAFNTLQSDFDSDGGDDTFSVRSTLMSKIQ